MSVTVFYAIALYLVAINLLTFAMFRIDKQRAIGDGWRIPEANLLTAAFFGGSVGARAGQVLLRHKSRKEPFRSQLKGIMILQVAVVMIATAAFFMPSQRGRVLSMLQATLTAQSAPAESFSRPAQVIIHRGVN
ncbi:DUF1294 domain-containing protein [Pararhodobacter zhoushanensis]|uniref:DUF1294 domain-containing protein n=1 Tax=Pararhodobacter zhoushanensis TaxID=2479545 RepID=A0ABT3GVN8_9RHOB|nr:DUF1294 domain-containing protein [Pararhodobacter zhoushanensis]MCW1931594.1 DUF1294 domain-containing protein [Pararhodobacter zhoushanensis]